jgi:hypothetical protein
MILLQNHGEGGSEHAQYRPQQKNLDEIEVFCYFTLYAEQ